MTIKALVTLSPRGVLFPDPRVWCEWFYQHNPCFGG